MLDFVTDGLVMVIDDGTVMIIFNVINFFLEDEFFLNPFKRIQIDTIYIGISMYLIS